MPEPSWSFDVDIVGRCNLSCPSCPVANMSGTPLQSGYISPELLDQIVRKAVSECKVTNFALYNWTEPFIHPKLLEEMIRQNVQDNNPALDVEKAYGPSFAAVSPLARLKRKFRNTILP